MGFINWIFSEEVADENLLDVRLFGGDAGACIVFLTCVGLGDPALVGFP